MNMQNIPSHALDIRHMFRATPRYADDIHVTFEESAATVELNLFRWSDVETASGTKTVNDLVENDTIHVKYGLQSAYATIVQIKEAEDPSYIKATLDTRVDYAQ